MLSYLFLQIAFYLKIDSSIKESEFFVSKVEVSNYMALKSEEIVPFREKLLSNSWATLTDFLTRST